MKKILKLLLVLVVVFVVIIGGLYLLTSIPKTANVDYTQADLDSYIDKTGITFHDNNASAEDILLENYTASGRLEVEGTITSEEATAIANEVINEKSFLKNIQIKFAGDDKVIASATIGSDLSFVYNTFPIASDYKTVVEAVKGKPLYIETSLIHEQDNTFFAMMENVNVGLVPMPIDQANVYGTEVGTILNRVLNNIPGFEVESFDIDSAGLHFKGTIPSETQSLADQVSE